MSGELAPVDVGLVAVFVAYCLAAGLRSRRVSSRSLEEYFLAGRTLPGWKAGISMAATQFAADTPLLVTGMIATGGIFALWRLWIYALAFLLMGFVLAGAWRRAGVLTDAELSELRYGTKLATLLRAAKAFYFGTLFNCTVMAMVLFAAGRVAGPFIPWDRWLPPAAFQAAGHALALTSAPLGPSELLSLLAVIAMTALYSTTGGLRAVVETDVVQFAVAILATLAYAAIVVHMVGGLGALPDALAAHYGASWTSETLAFTPTGARDAGWAVLGAIAIQWIAQVNADGTGYLAQRTMACRSDRDARDAALVFTVAQVLLRSLPWIAIGLSLLVLVPIPPAGMSALDVGAREATFVEGMERYLPPGVKGLMLTGMLAALASTLDTHLNWGASYWANDIYRRLVCGVWLRREPSPRALVWVARFSNLLVLVIALAILTRIESIQSAWKLSLLFGAGMGGPLVLRWLWWRITSGGELAAIVASSLLAPALLHVVDADGERMLLMAVAATGIAVAVSLLGPAEPREQLQRFYRRVRPPGFWGPIAAECGDAPRAAVGALARGLTATGGAALAVFCALVGLGTLLFGSPAPSWFPWRGPWCAGLLAASALLTAWLWRALRRRAGA